MVEGGRREPDLEAIHEVTRRLAVAETEQEICEAAVDSVATLFDDAVGGLWLFDSDAEVLELTAASDRAEGLFDGDAVARSRDGVAWAAFEQGDVRRCSEPATEHDAAPTVTAELVCPLGDHGVLTVAALDAGALGPTATQVARILATSVEAALTSAEREHALRLQNDRLEEFVGVVSHDLRNPLNVASGFLQQVQADVDDERLARVAAAVDRMETLVEDLLTLADEGYVVEDRTRLDLATVAERAWRTVETTDATLETQGTADIFGDEDRLLQVFENLFRNAIEHADGPVTVRVVPVQPLHTSTRTETGDLTDGFFVADDGSGIHPGDRDDVFDRGHSSGGTGLGLAIVERIVDAHGWEISVGEAVDGGAKFEVTGATKPVTPFESV